MTEPPMIEQARTRRKRVVVWAVVATLAALVTAALLLMWLFFVRQRTEQRSTARAAAPPASPFASLEESAIPGRYKWTEGTGESFIVLYDDHTFMNKDGTIFSMYRWELGPDSLAITFASGTHRFTAIEAPGVYTGTKRSGVIVRMEKLPPYSASELKPPTPVASIQLGAEYTTNGLTPVNTGGDGAIFPATNREVKCYQLVRKQNRTAGYLYLQIAPELKETPFTNALVLVEYFDPIPAAPNPRLWIQYDAQASAYANSQPLQLAGSETWQEATFYLAAARFENRQNGKGDFRLCSDQPELFVRSVKLVKNTILPEAKLPTSIPR
jgi:hypothetical protein